MWFLWAGGYYCFKVKHCGPVVYCWMGRLRHNQPLFWLANSTVFVLQMDLSKSKHKQWERIFVLLLGKYINTVEYSQTLLKFNTVLLTTDDDGDRKVKTHARISRMCQHKHD